MSGVLSRTSEALTPEEITSLLRKRVGDEHLLETVLEYDTFTVVLDNEGYRAAALACRDDHLLAFDQYETTIGIDEREDGFSVVTVLYSTTKGVRILLKTLAEGGRETPVAPSLADVYPGADWSERETWDMFGVEFDGHPGLAPRILTVENFEGWPLRKDFYLTTRVAKPWPGVKEPAELDEAGNVVARVPGPGEAPGPSALDKVMADQAKLANPAPAEPEEPVTEPVGDRPEQVETAADSGDVVESEKQRVEEDLNEVATDARKKAEDQRKAAAEARARKAAERSEQVHVSTPAEDVPDVPKAADASAEAGTQGGPPAQGPADDAGSNDPEPTVEGGISETIEQVRPEGSVDVSGGEPPVVPEGRTSDGTGDADEAGGPDGSGDGASQTDDEDGEEQS